MKSRFIIFSPIYITIILYLTNLFTQDFFNGNNELLTNSIYLIAISGFMSIILFIYFKEFNILKAYAIITIITMGGRTIFIFVDYFTIEFAINIDIIVILFFAFVFIYLVYFLSLLLIVVQAIQIENSVLIGVSIATIIYFFYEFSTKIDSVIVSLSSIMPLIAAEIIILSIGVAIKVAFLWLLNYESLFISTNINEEV